MTDRLASGDYARKQIYCPSRVVAWSHGSRFRLAARLATAAGSGRLLDYGCGDGTFMALTHGRFAEAVGADIDVEQLAECRRRLSDLPGLSFIRTADLHGPTHDHAYSVITCMEVLEHCPDGERVRVLDHLRSLMAPGGRLLISVPIEIGPALAGKQFFRAVAAWRGQGDYRHRETYSPRELFAAIMAGPELVRARYRVETSSGPFGYLRAQGIRLARAGTRGGSAFCGRAPAVHSSRSTRASSQQPGVVRMHASVTAPSKIRDRSVEQAVAAFLVGDDRPPSDPSSFTYVGLRHSLGPLLLAAGASRVLPADCVTRLRARSSQAGHHHSRTERQVARVLEALAEAGLAVLLIKGAQLANSCYPESYLRPREDTDLFVRGTDRARVTAVLARLGYTALPVQTGAEVLGQTLFDRAGSVAAALDVHWRVSQPWLVARLFDFDDLLSRSMTLPRLGPAARGPSVPDALALACVHQAAHHADHDLLLWSYDVHLLIEGLSAEERSGFLALAASLRIAAICIAAIEPAESLFRTRGSADLLARLRQMTLAGDEPSAALLNPGSRLARIRRDLAAVTAWRVRARLLAGHMFPPPAYMRSTYAPSSRAPLAWLYVRRLLLART